MRKREAIIELAGVLDADDGAEELEKALARSRVVDDILQDMEADQLAPAVAGDKDWGRRTRILVEQLRSVECLGRIAQMENRDLLINDFRKSGQAMLRRAYLALVATELLTDNDAGEMQALHDALWKQNQEDVRISQFKLTSQMFDQSVSALIRKYRSWEPGRIQHGPHAGASFPALHPLRQRA